MGNTLQNLEETRHFEETFAQFSTATKISMYYTEAFWLCPYELYVIYRILVGDMGSRKIHCFQKARVSSPLSKNVEISL